MFGSLAVTIATKRNKGLDLKAKFDGNRMDEEATTPKFQKQNKTVL